MRFIDESVDPPMNWFAIVHSFEVSPRLYLSIVDTVSRTHLHGASCFVVTIVSNAASPHRRWLAVGGVVETQRQWRRRALTTSLRVHFVSTFAASNPTLDSFSGSGFVAHTATVRRQVSIAQRGRVLRTLFFAYSVSVFNSTLSLHAFFSLFISFVRVIVLKTSSCKAGTLYIRARIEKALRSHTFLLIGIVFGNLVFEYAMKIRLWFEFAFARKSGKVDRWPPKFWMRVSEIVRKLTCAICKFAMCPNTRAIVS